MTRKMELPRRETALTLAVAGLFASPPVLAAPGDPIGSAALVTSNAVMLDAAADFSIARDAAGESVVVWWDNRGVRSAFRIAGRLFASDGTPAGPEFTVAEIQESVGIVTTPVVAMDATGDFVVVWRDDARGTLGDLGGYVGGLGSRILARRYAAGGATRGSIITVATGGFDPDVAMNDDGDFVVGWNTHDAEIGFPYSRPVHLTASRVRARQFSANGTPRGLPATLDFERGENFTADSAREVTVAIDGADNAVIGWTRLLRDTPSITSGVFAQRIGRFGIPVGRKFQVNDPGENANHPALAMNARGQLVATWQISDSATGGPAQVKVYAADGAVTLPQRPVSDAAPRTADAMNNVPSVAIDPIGNFVIAASTQPLPPGRNLLNVRLFDPAGTPLTPVRHIAPDAAEQPVYYSAVAMDAAGAPAVAYGETSARISVQRFTGP